MITIPGRVLLDEQLPLKYRNYGTLDKKGLKALYNSLATELPSDEYAKIAKNTAELGNRISYEYGGPTSVHLRDLIIPPEFRAYREQIKKDLYRIQQDRSLSPVEKRKRIIAYTHKATENLDKRIVDYLADQDNSFGLMVKNGIRGNATQLRQMVFGDLLSVDSKQQTIPMPTLRSYAEGVSPLEYWNASHGGRHGYVQIQMATPKAGYLSRRARQISHRVVVTSEDCGDPQPLMVDADDAGNVGSLLARDVKGQSGTVYKRNTIITPKILDDLTGTIPVRSAETCKAAEGVCAKCAGVHESRSLPEVGDVIGLNDINSFMIDATQAAISCLHPSTEVRMADHSVKRIADIKIGDAVIGVSAKDCSLRPARVTNVFNHGTMPMFIWNFYRANNPITLIATSEHKILCNYPTGNSIRALGDLGNRLAVEVSYKEPNPPILLHQRGVEEAGEFTAYDIEIDHPDHLFLLANGLVVSNSKHVGGEEKAAKRIKKGFEAIEQFLDMPENFVGGAVMSETSGKVGKKREAPQGGHYIEVGTREYWIPPDAELKVKPGQQIEAGDALTSGMVDISKVLEYKGIGEARKEFVKGFAKVLDDNNLSTQRRALESVSRGYLNKVQITDPDGLFGRLAGDYADYDDIAAQWTPRETSKKVRLQNVGEGYLDAPALHYTIGTKITPQVKDYLRKNGVSEVIVNKEPPPFKPVMVRAKTWVNTDKDFLTALSGENLMKTFLDRASHGADTYKDSISYYPRMAFESYTGQQVEI